MQQWTLSTVAEETLDWSHCDGGALGQVNAVTHASGRGWWFNEVDVRSALPY